MIILCAAILLTYLCYTVWVGRGIPQSLSQTYYVLGNRGWLFQLVMSVTGIGLYYPWSAVTPDELLCLPFIACGGLLFVATAPQFKIRLEGPVHYISAVVCGLAAALWLWLTGNEDTFIVCGAAALIVSIMDCDRYMWWMEMAVMGSLFKVLICI